MDALAIGTIFSPYPGWPLLESSAFLVFIEVAAVRHYYRQPVELRHSYVIFWHCHPAASLSKEQVKHFLSARNKAGQIVSKLNLKEAKSRGKLHLWVFYSGPGEVTAFFSALELTRSSTLSNKVRREQNPSLPIILFL
jgi:hypothetical protein